MLKQQKNILNGFDSRLVHLKKRHAGRFFYFRVIFRVILPYKIYCWLMFLK